MRKAISLLLASAFLFAGLWLFYMQLFVSPIIKGSFLMAAGLLVAAGGGWLFIDFIRPMWSKTEVD